ncbi:MAG TPA: DNA polymerase/3'-5' exonuclease PolX [Clostridia bacterium]|nr:DNA polymerase/3'-5' exonuclease PolX [Clostridia bacterium]
MDQKQVAAVLHEIGVLLELSGEQPFKSRAYYNGARTVEMLTEDLEQLVADGKLEALPGIGKTLAANITELVTTGRMQYHEELKAAIPAGVLELLRIPNLGPKKARVLYRELGITSIGELEYACKENRLITLKGFGAKTQEKLLAGIEYLKRFQGHYRLDEAWSQAVEMLDELKNHAGVVEAEIAGSIRRAGEIVKDVDLVAGAREPAQVTAYFIGLPQVEEVVAREDARARVKLQSGITADLLVVEPHQFVYALHHCTGSRAHLEALEELAKNMKLTVNEYGIFHGDELLRCGHEEELYRTLGLDYIPPELRENLGEIEASLAGRLPHLVEMTDIKGVFHVHTDYSDGSHTLEQMVAGAVQKGYRYIGIADHSQSAFYAGGLKEADIRRQHEEIRSLQEKYPEILIFKGIEADILADGSLDYDDEILALFDFVIASVHHFQPGKDLTERLLKAVSHPAVTILGHPTGRLLLAREGYRVDMEAVLAALRQYQVAVELNASPARLDLDWRYFRRAKELGVKVSINPDAHRVEDLDHTFYGVLMARKGWLEAGDVFNAMGPRKMKRYLEERRSRWAG